MTSDQDLEEELRGFKAAKETIQKGKDPQEAYDSSLGDIDSESFFLRGWQKACREAGAKDEDGE